MQDRFEDIKTFVAIAQTRQLSEAADRLGVVRSAVSRRLQDLEQRLGVRLVSRNTRSLSLTEAGEEFYRRSLSILEELAEAEAVAARTASTVAGRLRITAPVSWSVHHLMPVLDEFARIHPSLEVDLRLTDHIVDIVDEGFDVALRISRLKDSALVARRIAPITHVAVASPAYLLAHGVPLHPEDLRKHHGLNYSNVDDRLYWQFRDPESAELFSVDVPSTISVNNGDALRELAVRGAGVAHIPGFIACHAIAAGTLRVVLQAFARPPMFLYAVYPSRRHVSTRLRVFIEFLVERFGTNPPWEIGTIAEPEQAVSARTMPDRFTARRQR